MPDESMRDDRESLNRTCANCGAALDPDDRYCRNCGTPVGAVGGTASGGFRSEDPFNAPTERLEEVERDTGLTAMDEPPIIDEEPEPASGTGAKMYRAASLDPYATPRRGSSAARTWLIVLLIVAFILVVCCCLFLGIALLASADTAFRDELESAARGLPLILAG